MNLTLLTLLLFASSIAFLHMVEDQDVHAIPLTQTAGLEGSTTLDTDRPATMSHITSSGIRPLSHIEAVPGDGSITLTWSQFVRINHHEIVVRDSQDNVIREINVNSNNVTLDNLTNGVEYDISISSYNVNRLINLEIKMAETHISATPGVPHPPSNITSTVNGQAFTITWNSPENNGSDILHYLLEYTVTNHKGENQTKHNEKHQLSSHSTTFTKDNGIPGWTYHTTIYAVNVNGKSPHVGIPVIPIGIPEAVEDLRAQPSYEQVTLEWQEPNTGGSDIIQYVITSRIGNVNPFAEIERISGDKTSFTVKELSNYTEYQFAIYAINAEGQGPINMIKATPGTVPDAPTNLAGSRNGQQVTLTWDAPVNPVGNPVTSYVIEYSSSLGTGKVIQIGCTCTTINTNQYESYKFTVYAVNIVGKSTGSDTIEVAGAPFEPPPRDPFG